MGRKLDYLENLEFVAAKRGVAMGHYQFNPDFPSKP
jgi:hypothetical protein